MQENIQYYIFGSNVMEQDIRSVQNNNIVFVNKECLYFGTDYGFACLEELLSSLNNNSITNMLQIFLIGSSSFFLKIFLNEESFLRRYPLTSTFLKLAKDGEERDSQSFHKVYQNINLYIINLYTKHKDNITFEL